MKKFTYIILLLALGLNAKAQEYKFEYDEAGNRTARLVINLKSTDGESFAEADSDNIDEKALPDNPVEDMLGKTNLKIYPNPTRGELALEFINFPENGMVELQLRDITGRLLEKSEVNTRFYLLDMHDYGEGTYLLQLKADSEQKTYEIIKN